MCSFMVEHHVAVKKDGVSLSTRARELSQTGQLRRRSLGIAWKLAAPAYGALTDLCPRRLMRALPWRMQVVVGHRRLFPAAWFLCQALISGGHKIQVTFLSSGNRSSSEDPQEGAVSRFHLSVPASLFSFCAFPE